MVRIPLFLSALLFSVAPAAAAGESIQINSISPEGVGKSLGTIDLTESGDGVKMKVSVSGVADGDHGFHVHEKGDCGPGTKDGKKQAGLAAGGHFDPKSTKSHKGPGGGGHEGDLPKLTAAGGKIDETVTIEGVKLADFSGRSLMIHEGGDNYSDNPENGGGKGRIACGVIKQ
jgi:Cu-Zn family superoxide dismutase